MRTLILWVDRLPLGLRLVLGALATALPFYFAALLSYLVASEAALGRPYGLALHASVVVVLLTLVVFAGRYAAVVRSALREDLERRRAALMHAYTFVDRFETQRLHAIHPTAATADPFVNSFVTSVDELQQIVYAAYQTFEAAFGKGIDASDRVDFEITFMTKSYNDGRITIPAYANREGRAPRSMLLRASETDIYERTVTAVIYREPRPSMRIIPDTSNRESEYQELYPGQRQRIKSSIIFPVLSDTNELLGTLVAHCDKTNFFLHDHEKYWDDMMEIFAKRIALIKRKMDVLSHIRSRGQREMTVEIPDFGF